MRETRAGCMLEADIAKAMMNWGWDGLVARLLSYSLSTYSPTQSKVLPSKVPEVAGTLRTVPYPQVGLGFPA